MHLLQWLCFDWFSGVHVLSQLCGIDSYMTLIDTVCCTDSVYVVYYEYTDTLMSACPILIMWQPLLKAGQLTVATHLMS